MFCPPGVGLGSPTGDFANPLPTLRIQDLRPFARRGALLDQEPGAPPCHLSGLGELFENRGCVVKPAVSGTERRSLPTIHPSATTGGVVSRLMSWPYKHIPASSRSEPSPLHRRRVRYECLGDRGREARVIAVLSWDRDLEPIFPRVAPCARPATAACSSRLLVSVADSVICRTMMLRDRCRLPCRPHPRRRNVVELLLQAVFVG